MSRVFENTVNTANAAEVDSWISDNGTYVESKSRNPKGNGVSFVLRVKDSTPDSDITKLVNLLGQWHS